LRSTALNPAPKQAEALPLSSAGPLTAAQRLRKHLLVDLSIAILVDPITE